MKTNLPTFRTIPAPAYEELTFQEEMKQLMEYFSKEGFQDTDFQ